MKYTVLKCKDCEDTDDLCRCKDCFKEYCKDCIDVHVELCGNDKDPQH